MARARNRRRGYLEQLPSGSVHAVVFAGSDPLTGRLRYIRETCKTVAEAEVAVTKLLRQVDEQLHPKSAITVRETRRRLASTFLDWARSSAHLRCGCSAPW